MGEVIELRRSTDDQEGQHLSGVARCLDCGHEWPAAAPLGTTWLECPECHNKKGAFKYPVIHDSTWLCNCGNQLFYLTPDGAQCPRCGVFPTDWC
jgi:DNA-directed RNA polymerase subunit RPC12/RpoP